MADEVRKRGRPKKEPQQENNFSQQEYQNNQSDFIENSSNTQNNNRFNTNRDMSDSRSGFTDEDDDLKSFLKKKKLSNNKSVPNQNQNVDIDEETLREIEEFESSDGLNDIPNEEFNPLNEAVQKRAYTGGMVGNNPNPNPNISRNERVIEEPNYKSNGANKLEVDKDLLNPNNDIPKDNADKKQEKSSSNSSGNNNGGGGNDTNSGGGEKVNGEENVKELSPQEQREAMSKTADVFLLAYRTYVPMPFVYASTYSDKKLQDLHNKNQINLETEIKRDGTTFREYYKDFNEKVEQSFVVTDAEVEAIREPLIDVLMEKKVAFTPTQRLMFTVGQLLAAKTMAAAKFYMEKQNDIEEMKNIHKEKLKMQEEILDKLDKQEEQRKKDERKNQEQKIRDIEEQILRERQQQQQEEQDYEDEEVEEKTILNVVRDEEDEKEEVITEDKIEEVKQETQEEQEEQNTIFAAPTLDDVIDNYDDGGYDFGKIEPNDIPE